MTSKTKPDNRAHRPRTRTFSYLTQDETKRLFSVIKSKRDRAIFLTAYRHGLRACEIGYCPRNAPAATQPAASLAALLSLTHALRARLPGGNPRTETGVPGQCR